MSEYPLDHSFNSKISEIWLEHKNRTILTQALGIDPHVFAWDVIHAWDHRRIPDFSDFDDLPEVSDDFDPRSPLE